MYLWWWWFSQYLMFDSCDTMDCSLPGSVSMGFPRQEYWSGLPFPSPGNLPDPGIEPSLEADSLLLSPQRKPRCISRRV